MQQKPQLELKEDSDLVLGQPHIVFTPSFDKDAETKVQLKEVSESQVVKTSQEQKKKAGAKLV